MWIYSQSTGLLTNPDRDEVGRGYSGNGDALNSPAHQGIRNRGPIPQGLWTVGTFFDDPEGKGPVVSHLMPAAGTQTFGRSGFMIHGDTIQQNHTASEGCIILARPYRMEIAASKDRQLLVVA